MKTKSWGVLDQIVVKVRNSINSCIFLYIHVHVHVPFLYEIFIKYAHTHIVSWLVCVLIECFFVNSCYPRTWKDLQWTSGETECLWICEYIRRTVYHNHSFICWCIYSWKTHKGRISILNNSLASLRNCSRVEVLIFY